jgi:SPP1 family predicted phage head-tail adaptor
MYNHELTLISEKLTYDDYGVPRKIELCTDVLCKVKSVGRNEFYGAATTGLRPEIIFVIHGYEYNGEKKVEFEGNKYNVIRTYSTDFEEIELTCERDR